MSIIIPGRTRSTPIEERDEVQQMKPMHPCPSYERWSSNSSSKEHSSSASSSSLEAEVEKKEEIKKGGKE